MMNDRQLHKSKRHGEERGYDERVREGDVLHQDLIGVLVNTSLSALLIPLHCEEVVDAEGLYGRGEGRKLTMEAVRRLGAINFFTSP
jgi:hypothetical protein